MDSTDRALLGAVQSGFPLVPRPFAALGEALGLSESQVIARLARLQSQGLIRRIGPVLDPEKLGRVGALAAMAVPPHRLQPVAEAVSAFPTVTHNYQRVALNGACPYNLWFTLTAGSEHDLAATLAAIAEATGIQPQALPVRRKFKIAVRFQFTDDDSNG